MTPIESIRLALSAADIKLTRPTLAEVFHQLIFYFFGSYSRPMLLWVYVFSTECYDSYFTMTFYAEVLFQDNAAYVRKSESQLTGLYYLVLWKNYFKEENT